MLQSVALRTEGHMKRCPAQSLVTPTKPGDVFSSAVLSNGNPYGVADGLVYSFPCRSKVWSAASGLDFGWLMSMSRRHAYMSDHVCGCCTRGTVSMRSPLSDFDSEAGPFVPTALASCSFNTDCEHSVQGDGDYEIVDDFIIDDFLRQKLKISEDELLKERACVGHLIPGDEAAACEITVDTMLPGEN